MGTRHLYWILTGPSFAVHQSLIVGEQPTQNEGKKQIQHVNKNGK
jgi:hypothetical protein